jgi:hypothetical protein
MTDLMDVFEDGTVIIPEEISFNDKRLITFEIVNEEANTSERVHGYIVDTKEIDKYHTGCGKYNVVLVTQPTTYSPVLRRGLIVQLIGTGFNTLPILDNEWFFTQHDKLPKYFTDRCKNV